MNAAALTAVLLSGLAAGTLAAVAVTLVLHATPRASPRARYLFILAALCASLAAPVAPAVAPRSNEIVREGVGAVWFRGGSSGPQDGAARAAAEPRVDTVAAWEALLRAAATPPLAGWVVALWAAGAVLLLAREALAHHALLRRRRTWRAAPPEALALAGGRAAAQVFYSAMEGPLAVGLLRPSVVLPEWLPADAAEAVLRHELDHARWRDPLVNALVRLACAIAWPWPHVWYLAALAREEREVAADRAGAGPGPGRDPAVYAETLLRVARRTSPSAASLAYPSHAAGHLERRIRRLFGAGDATNRSLALLAPAALLVCAGAAAALPASPPAEAGETRTASAAAGPSRPASSAAGRIAAIPARTLVPRAWRTDSNAAVSVTLRTSSVARRKLRFVNLPGTPLEVVASTADDEGDEITHPVIRLRNRSGRTVSEFALAFGAGGRATAVLRDTSDIVPGGEYVVRLPGDGTIHHPRQNLTVGIIQAQLDDGETWGIPAPPGVLPPLPSAFATPTSAVRAR